MPYIKKELRNKLEPILNAFCFAEVNTPGEMNYLFTRLLQLYMKTKGESYQTHNDIVGILECCKIEWYRKSTMHYENQKIQENGDV